MWMDTGFDISMYNNFCNMVFVKAVEHKILNIIFIISKIVKYVIFRQCTLSMIKLCEFQQ